MKVVSYSLKTSSLLKHEFQHEIVRRPPKLTRLSAETVTVTTEGPEKYKRTAICPHPLITVPHPVLSSPLLRPSPSIVEHGPLPVTAMARRPHGGVALGRCTIFSTTRAVHFVPLKTPVIQGVGERSTAGVDTNAYFTTQISSSQLRPRRLIQHMGEPC